MKRFDFHPDNLGGLLCIYAVPPTSFVRIRTEYADNVHHLELTKIDDIIQIPVIDDRSFEFAEELTFSEAGCGWQVTIEGLIPHLDAKHNKLIRQLEGGYWYVLCVDANGVPHWCGQQNAYMVCNTRKVTGGRTNDINGTSISFACIQDEPSLIVADDADFS